MAAPPAVSDAAKVKVCQGHTRPICHVAYSKVIDGTYWFVTSCHDAKPMLRNGETGDWVGTFEGHRGAVYCSAMNAEATRVVTGSGDYTAMLWDALTGQKLGEWTHSHYVKTVDWTDGLVATGNYNGTALVFDVTRPGSDPVTTVPVTTEKPGVKAVYFVGGTDTLCTAQDKVIKLWDLRAGPTAQSTREVPGLNVLEYTHKHYLVAASGRNVLLLNPTTLDVVRTVQTTEDVECASLSPCGRFLCAGSKLKAKEFTIDGTELDCNRGHHGPIFHVRYAPDGSSYASGSEDSMVRLWPSHETLLKLGLANNTD